ncbi:oxysterol-binding protein domain-containing protein [Ditylenchus destructor]|uniref:Oxysterol-binding protein n=1 Tax=Ditylenchus destructor TaxID=166010 RepID=A0AAD4N3P1_9BILA|nr:oxysterol-binding protein domain-containing protein [Ditylenchus destructor]
MEGSLSKWTNMVQGWQYRYFVLNDDVLCYYTSKEKMLRNQLRGCIRLRGAAIGIDGENNSLFTITVDGKTFHLQGKDQSDRDLWVRALERVIHDKSGYYKPQQEDPGVDLQKKIAHAEKQSQTLLEQVRKLEQISEKSDSERKKTLTEVLATTKQLQSIVDNSILVLRQVQRHLGTHLTEGDDKEKEVDSITDVGDDPELEPPVSYSSSEDEFFDATSQATDRLSAGSGGSRRTSARHLQAKANSTDSEPDWGDSQEDFDKIYDNSEENAIGNLKEQHGSVLMHLLSQVSVGMDLTKVTLPTFILERRSLLEMYADFFAHPDDFVRATDLSTPEDRFISVVKYYLNSIYPARKSGVAKKPYNPILGETFRCRWTVPGLPETGKKTDANSPFPDSDYNQITFIAEQVSHHPPVSAFYAEHPASGVSFSAHIWTKSSFLGLSIGVTNIGNGVVKLHKFDESYIVTFPVEVKCEKTGYNAEIDFLVKPFFGGKPHKISGNIYKTGVKKPIMTLRGEWNGHIYAKKGNEEEFLFSDVREKPDVPKECVPVAQQSDRESRRLWRHVTAALFRNKINTASSAKRFIEQRQRDEAKRRQEKGETWNCHFFEKQDGPANGWSYKYSLDRREQ